LAHAAIKRRPETYKLESLVKLTKVLLDKTDTILLLRSSLVSDRKWLNLSDWMDWISFTSKYSSVVSGGMFLGISRNLARLQRTMVPVQVHFGGQ
jgi:hypothetical protein